MINTSFFTQNQDSPDDFVVYAVGRQRWQKPDGIRWFGRLFALPSYHWVLLAVLMVLCVHISYLPWWLTGFGLISIIAQLPTIKSRFTAQPKKLKSWYQGTQILGFLLGLLGIWLSFGQILGVDVSISFLALCLFGKLWEMFKRRDAYVVLNLALFVLAASFLWSQSLLMAMAVFVALLATILGFIALADSHNREGSGRLRALGMIILPALPLLVVLFLFFPRLPPLWTINMAGSQATTGVSDSMSPGDFANLSQSTELAFRVEFSGVPPARNQLYWRGMVFSDFDGITWRVHKPDHQRYWRSLEPMPDWANIFTGTKTGEYRVILEPTYQNWLFALDYSRPSPTRGVGMTDEFTLRSFRPIAGQFLYQLSYYPDSRVGQHLEVSEYAINTALPKGNLQSRQLADELYARAGGDTRRYVNEIYRYIQNNQFSYTLSPPLLGGERIDEFLFTTRQGFCEHYASSFVFLMRAVGVPARVVAGYQGGQLGRDGQSWEVRQMDAHAWAEIWIADEGWVRVDPTGFVAPDRILSGMNDFTQMVGSSMFGDGVAAQLGYQQFRLIQSLRRYSDQMGYYWNQRVVGYDGDGQKNTLMRWFNIQSLTQQVMTMAMMFVLIAAVIGFVFWYRRRVVHHVFDAPVVRLSQTLGKKDKKLVRLPHEGVLTYLQRLQTSGNTELITKIDELMHTYRQYRFGQLSQTQGSASYHKQAKQFAKKIKQLGSYF